MAGDEVCGPEGADLAAAAGVERRVTRRWRRDTSDRLSVGFRPLPQTTRIGAIAARARRLGMEYNEAEERQQLEAGEIGVDDLQRHADKLEEKLRTRRRWR